MSAGIDFKPRILGFLCNWCCYAGADLCGVSRYQYPPYIRVIRLMCSGRVDMAFVLRAFSKGIDGVFIGGCWPGECHYATEGNYDARSTVHLCKKLLQHIGVDPERLRLEWVSASEGIRFAEIMNDFSAKLKRLGPIEIEKHGLKGKLDAATELVPYIKLVEREKLRVPAKNVEEYRSFFAGDEVDALIRELVVDKLELIQVMALLREKPRSAGGISKILGLSPSKTSRYIKNLVNLGLIRFHEGQKRFVCSRTQSG